MKTSELLCKKLGEFVASERRFSGLTQAALAAKMKTKQPSLARAEHHGCSIAFAEKALNIMGKEIGFHHISVGTKQSYTSYFLGGILYQDQIKL